MPIPTLLVNTQSKPPNLSPHLKPYLTLIHHQILHIVHGTFPRRSVTPHSCVCHSFHQPSPSPCICICICTTSASVRRSHVHRSNRSLPRAGRCASLTARSPLENADPFSCLRSVSRSALQSRACGIVGLRMYSCFAVGVQSCWPGDYSQALFHGIYCLPLR